MSWREGWVREEVKLLVEGLPTKINLSARSFVCLSTHRDSISSALQFLAGKLTALRRERGTGGAGSQRTGRPCWSWPICGAGTPTPSSPPGSASASVPSTGT